MTKIKIVKWILLFSFHHLRQSSEYTDFQRNRGCLEVVWRLSYVVFPSVLGCLRLSYGIPCTKRTLLFAMSPLRVTVHTWPRSGSSQPLSFPTTHATPPYDETFHVRWNGCVNLLIPGRLLGLLMKVWLDPSTPIAFARQCASHVQPSCNA